MKPVFCCFLQMVRQIKSDAMLFAACLAPVLCGCFFKFGLPWIERLLTNFFSASEIITPFYLLFDLFLALITPIMFCFISALTILEERDEHTAAFLAVTPLGKRGYLIARLGIPCAISFFVTLIIMLFFTLTVIKPATLLLLSLCGAVQGVLIALIVVSFSSNKLEGMAVTKLTTLIILGAPAPFFIDGSIQFFLSPLPSFWMAKGVLQGQNLLLIVSIVLTLLYCFIFTKRFYKKL